MRNTAFILVLSLLFILTCEKENNNNINTDTFNTTIIKSDTLIQPTELDNPVEIEMTDSTEQDGDYICNTIRYKAAPGYNELLLLDPTSDVIYPGAIIKGETVLTGEYTPIIANRKPLNISISLQNITGSPARTIDDPKLSTVRTAINDILSSEVTGATAAKINFEVKNVYSEEHIYASIAANYSNSSIDVGGSFDYNNDKNNGKIVVKYLQAYYTLDIDLPAFPSDFFEDLPDTTILGSTSPLYVSTVTYGRMVLFTATSEYSNIEMNAAFNAAFNSGVHDGSLDVSADYSNIINSSEIKAFILGGSGEDATKSVNGIEGVKEFILGGGNYSKDSPGAPISYKLRYLKDNSIANIILATDYNVRQCTKAKSKFQITLKHLNCAKVTEEGATPDMYGKIVVYWGGGANDYFVFWEKDEEHFQRASGYIVDINKTTTFTLSNPTANTYISLWGELWEDDYSGDDYLGQNSKKVYLPQLAAGLDAEVIFNGDGDQASAVFSIIPID